MRQQKNLRRKLRGLQDKNIVLEAIEKIGKWDIMLAGIRDNELLIVKNGQCPDKIEINGMSFLIKHYEPEEYIEIAVKNEEEFRKYKTVYFVKIYMRKLLDRLASEEVNRFSMDNMP